MQGKIVVVTGATSGIGKETALGLARMGATVIGVGRSPGKCQQIALWIRDLSGNRNVSYLWADLSQQAEIRALASLFEKRYTRLDVLINNVGGLFSTLQKSADGIEMTFALNHLSYFLLTNLLLDLLKKSTPSRVINVSSVGYIVGSSDYTSLSKSSGYSAFRAYGRSKLANILFTQELARRLSGTGVTVNAVHPGLVSTHFGYEAYHGILGKVWKFGMQLIGRSPETGAQPSIYLASAPEVEGITGQYFVRYKSVQPLSKARDSAAAQRLWDVSVQLTHLSENSFQPIIDKFYL